MKDAFQQIPPENFEQEAKLEPIDLETMAREFEAVMQDYRKARTVINNEDGSRTIHETYRLPIFNEDSLVEKYIGNFCHMASVLGYRSTIGPLVIPYEQKILRGEGQTRSSIFLFLEKKEE
jgi:hypothetical protein